MKKAIMYLGLLAVVILMIGAAFKTLHYPGAAIAILTGASLGDLFLIIFLITGIKNLKSNTEKINAVIFAITMFFIVTGFALKSLHLPGAGILLITSHISLFVAAIMMFVDAFSEKESSRQILKVLFAFALFIFAIILLFLYFYITSLTV